MAYVTPFPLVSIWFAFYAGATVLLFEKSIIESLKIHAHLIKRISAHQNKKRRFMEDTMSPFTKLGIVLVLEFIVAIVGYKISG